MQSENPALALGFSLCTLWRGRTEPGRSPAMITRFPGLTPTRSRAVIHDGLVFTVAVSPDGDPSFYEQTRKALKRIDESLAVSGSDKSRILSAVVYIADIARKEEMNKAWDEWLDRTQPPMRACLGVALEPPHLVEIVVTAAELHPAKLPRARRILKFLSMKPEFPEHTL
jgi:enamine deaminase RidA (YjgF/YER057c/UK114 family)